MTDTSVRRRFATLVDLVLSHDGRIRRLQYWLGLLAAATVTGFFAGIADEVVHGTGEIGRYVTFGFIVGCFIWMHSAVTIKRLHDRDRAGLWYFLYGLGPPGLLLWAVYLHAENNVTLASPLYVLAMLGFLWVTIELGLMRGSAGPNRFGAQ